MNIQALDKHLIALAEKRMALSLLDYNDDQYDALEEELHELEDDFLDSFGADFEKVLEKIHQNYCPDSEVLSPIAYLANEYTIKGQKEDGSPDFAIKNYKQGLFVETAEEEAGRLVILPNPPRIFLFTKDGKKAEKVWQA